MASAAINNTRWLKGLLPRSYGLLDGFDDVVPILIFKRDYERNAKFHSQER
jgi:hypothetical protein